jgi:hypothetical protein
VLLLTLVLLSAAASALSVSTFRLQDSAYVVVENPERNSITIQIYDKHGNLNQSVSGTDTKLVATITGSGTWTVKVLLNGTEYRTEYIGIGSIVDTGFKRALMDAFEGDLSIVAVVAMVGIGIFTATIGRYAGLPIFLAALGIFAYNGYLPAWMSYLVVLAAAFFLAVAIYRWTGGG